MQVKTAEVASLVSAFPPTVMAIAKGLSIVDIAKRIESAKRVSRILWATVAVVAIYALSWVWDGRYGIFLWTSAIAFALSVKALGYAYRVWQAVNHRRGGFSLFLREPSRWFV